MNIRFLSLSFFVFFSVSGFFAPAFAHEGIPVETDGCHECRAEDGCFFFDYWSVPRVTRHCHGVPKAVAATSSAGASLEMPNPVSSVREARVLRVLSGDELEVEFEDDKARALVQLLGIQNPAAYEDEDSPLCREKMEKKAVSHLEDLVLDKKVKLRTSLRGEDFLEDGTLLRAVSRGKAFVNAEMLQDGYAMTDESHTFEFLSELSGAWTVAREEKEGVWSSTFCDEKKNGAFFGMLLSQVSRYRSLPAMLQYGLAAFGLLGIYGFGRLIRKSRITA